MLALIAGAFVHQASAQKGGILLYGNFGFSSSSNKFDNGFTTSKDITTTLVFSPGIGYALSDNMIVGLNLGITSVTSKPDGGSNSTTSTFMAGPFLRYTQKMGDIFSFYGQANLSYVGGKRDDSYSGGTFKRSGVDFNVTPNIGIAVGKGWGLNFGFGELGFSSITEKDDDNDDAKTTNSDFGLNLNGSTLRWGVSYMFNCGSSK